MLFLEFCRLLYPNHSGARPVRYAPSLAVVRLFIEWSNEANPYIPGHSECP
jgi:hypothetical protein